MYTLGRQSVSHARSANHRRPRVGPAVVVVRHSAAGVQARGGIIGIEAECNVTKTIRVGRIDADGILTDTVELAQPAQGRHHRVDPRSFPAALGSLVTAAQP